MYFYIADNSFYLTLQIAEGTGGGGAVWSADEPDDNALQMIIIFVFNNTLNTFLLTGIGMHHSFIHFQTSSGCSTTGLPRHPAELQIHNSTCLSFDIFSDVYFMSMYLYPTFSLACSKNVYFTCWLISSRRLSRVLSILNLCPCASSSTPPALKERCVTVTTLLLCTRMCST